MVRFANTLAIELKEGFWINRLKFVLLCLCFALLSVQFLNQYDVTSDIVDGAIVQLSGQGRFTAGDVLFSYFRGVRVESVSSQGLFAFPIGWFALQMVVAAIVGYYPVRHDGYDYQLALRSSSRIVIAVCRLIWIVLVVLSVFILGVVMSAFTAFLAGDLVFGLSPSMLNAMYGASMTIFDPCQSVIFFCVPLAGLLSLSVAQAFVAGVTEPVIGIIAITLYGVASVYVDSAFLVSGRTMLLRCFSSNNLSPILFGSYLPCVVCFVVFAAMFIILFSRIDFLNVDKESR